MTSLVERLRDLPVGKLRRHDPASAAEIDEIESVTGFTLPADLREVLEWSNGIAIHSSKTGFSMGNAYELAYDSSEPQFDEGLPGMLILGTDNGGSVFYADPSDQIGRGAWAIYLVDMSLLDIPHSIFVAESFTAAVETLLAETNVFERPQLRKQVTP